MATPTNASDTAAPPRANDGEGRAMRLDDAFREFRERRAARRGLLPTVIPFTGYGSTSWVRVLGRVLLTNDSRSRHPDRSVRGWRSFTSVPVDSVAVRVLVGSREHLVHADRGGVIDVRLEADLQPGWRTVTMRTEDPNWAESADVEAQVFVFDPDVPFGIVSDIDDTVMVTALPRPLLAAWNTFVANEHARTPTPGMSVLYDRLRRKHAGAPIIYLSTGAWNAAPTLKRFLSRNLYPPGPLLLTDWGPTPGRIFRSGRAHKIAQLSRLADEFPDMQWLLIGDDGQHDEETYDGFARAHRKNVAAICIRELSTSEAVLAGSRSRSYDREAETDVNWVYAPDGKGMVTQLEQAGLL